MESAIDMGRVGMSLASSHTLKGNQNRQLPSPNHTASASLFGEAIGFRLPSRRPLTQDVFSLALEPTVTSSAPTLGRVLSLKFGGAPRFKIMSFNMQKLSSESGKGAKAIKSAKAQVILDSDPDMVLLQEAGNAKIFREWVEEYLPEEYQGWAFVDSPYSNSMGIGIVYKPSRVSNMVVVPHVNPDNYAVKKTRPYPEIHFTIDGKVHLAGIASHLSGQARFRYDEAEFLRERLDDLTRTEPYVFFMGDLNADEESNLLDIFRQPGEGAPMITVPDADKIDRNDSKSYINPVNHNEVTLDHMMVSPQLYQFVSHGRTRVVGSFTNAPYRSASDHLPVILNFKVPDVLNVVCSAFAEFSELIHRAKSNPYATRKAPVLKLSA